MLLSTVNTDKVIILKPLFQWHLFDTSTLVLPFYCGFKVISTLIYWFLSLWSSLRNLRLWGWRSLYTTEVLFQNHWRYSVFNICKIWS